MEGRGWPGRAQILSEPYEAQKMTGIDKSLVETSDHWKLGHFFECYNIYGARTAEHRG